jgi:hypothetical protein
MTLPTLVSLAVVLSLAALPVSLSAQAPTVAAPTQEAVCVRGVKAWSPLTPDLAARTIVSIRVADTVRARFTYTATGVGGRRLRGMAECYFTIRGGKIGEKAWRVEMTANGATEVIVKPKELQCFNSGKYC